jgi:type I restriction enzyme, S subunit
VSGVKEVTLGDVASIVRTTIEPSDIREGTLYIGLENITTGGRFTGVTGLSPGEVTSTKFVFSESDVLFGKLRPYLAKVARPRFGGVCSTDILPIQPGPKLDRNYLAHFLLQPNIVALAAQHATGANLPRLSPKELERFRLPLPSLQAQQRIARVLDTADMLRIKRNKTLATLESLVGSIFIKIFGDPRKNEYGWRLGHVGDLIASANYGSSAKAGLCGEYPVLRMGNITSDGRIDMTDLKYLDLEPRNAERYLVRAGDVLFNRTNSPKLVGKTAVYQGEAPVAFAGYLVRVRMKDGNAPDYLSGYLNTRHGKLTLRGMCKSIIGMANINAQELRSIPILLPPIARQKHFARSIGVIERERQRMVDHLGYLDQLFASLQGRAFKGEL